LRISVSFHLPWIKVTPPELFATRMVKLRGIRKTKLLLHLKETEWR
jgi:hypothetical protein